MIDRDRLLRLVIWEDGDVDPDDKDGLEPGTFVRYASGDVYLVGDMNSDAGLCGCCRINEPIVALGRIKLRNERE